MGQTEKEVGSATANQPLSTPRTRALPRGLPGTRAAVGPLPRGRRPGALGGPGGVGRTPCGPGRAVPPAPGAGARPAGGATRLEPSLVRASEVVCMALSEATLDRLERLC